MSDSEEESQDRQVKVVVLGDGTSGKVSPERARPRRPQPQPRRPAPPGYPEHGSSGRARRVAAGSGRAEEADESCPAPLRKAKVTPQSRRIAIAWKTRASVAPRGSVPACPLGDPGELPKLLRSPAARAHLRPRPPPPLTPALRRGSRALRPGDLPPGRVPGGHVLCQMGIDGVKCEHTR